MPVYPNLVEKMLIKSNAFPVPLMDAFIYWFGGKAVLVAGKPGVFEALAKGPCSAAELARKIKASENGERAARLEEAVRQGRPSVSGWEWMDQHQGAYRDAQLHWRGIARLTGGEVASKVKLSPQAKRHLDLGGEHGLYGPAQEGLPCPEPGRNGDNIRRRAR